MLDHKARRTATTQETGKVDKTHPERTAPKGLLAGRAAAVFGLAADVWKFRTPARAATREIAVIELIFE